MCCFNWDKKEGKITMSRILFSVKANVQMISQTQPNRKEIDKDSYFRQMN